MRPKNAADGNGPSAVALCLSVFVHGAVIALMFLAPVYIQDSPKTVYAEVFAPQEKKIIWYSLRKPPVITPTQRIGTAPVPQGREKRKDVMISVDPAAKPGKQLLWRPDTEKRVEKEIPAANLIAVETKQEAVKPLKPFSPPPSAGPAEVKKSELPTAPAMQFGAPDVSPLNQDTAPKPRRAFVPPPPLVPPVPRPNTDQLIAPAPLQNSDLRAGEIPQAGVLGSLLGTSSTRPHRPFVAPPAAKGKGGGSPVNLADSDPAAPLGGGVNAVVLSASPVDKLMAMIPEGSRSVEMSGAPTVGTPSSGAAAGPGGLRMAGVAVSPGVPAPPAGGTPKLPGPPAPGGPVIYEETRVAAVRSTLSAPLRPSSRTIPRQVESRFHGRVVYSMIISKPQMPMYAGDWVLWFAEKDPMPGNAPQVRSPLPIRKIETVSEHGQTTPTGRIQLAATISKNGQVNSPWIFDGVITGSALAAIKDLQSWQFLPALRGGEAVDVEIILEIPFQENSIDSTRTTKR